MEKTLEEKVMDEVIKYGGEFCGTISFQPTVVLFSFYNKGENVVFGLDLENGEEKVMNGLNSILVGLGRKS